MSKEQQISNIEEIIIKKRMDCCAWLCSGCKHREFKDKGKNGCTALAFASEIMNAGYGHIPTAIKEFAEKLKEELSKDEYDCWGRDDRYHNVRIIIDELLEEYKE